MRQFLVTFKTDANAERELRGLNYFEINGIIKRYMVDIPQGKVDRAEVLKNTDGVLSVHSFPVTATKERPRRKNQS